MKALFISCCLALLLLTGCGEDADTESEKTEYKENTDPTQGKVRVYGDNVYDFIVWKRCDGTTLVYFGDSGGVVPNSPECKKK